jgi:Arc/MetJ family transcription regulator
MTRRTSINLDFDLVAQAKEVLNTTETTETIHRALSEVVRQARLQRLAGRRFDVRHADLDELRRPRTNEASPITVSAREPG